MTNNDLALLMAALVIFEALQVLIMNLTLRSIKAKMELIIPEGKSAEAILSDTVYKFMEDLQTDPKKAQIVGGFIRGAAVAGFEEIRGKIPMLGGAQQIDENLERIAKKNPWAGLILTGIQIAAPQLQQMAANQSSQSSNSTKRGGGKSGSGW